MAIAYQNDPPSAEYESRIIEYARQLDSQSESSPLVSRDDVALAIADVLVRLRPTERGRANQLFKRLIVRLGMDKL